MPNHMNSIIYCTALPLLRQTNTHLQKCLSKMITAMQQLLIAALVVGIYNISLAAIAL